VVGRTLGHYSIKNRLGRGGFGEVFGGIDQLLKRPVAIKVLRPELNRDITGLGRFMREAESLARLNHANIATLYTLHREGDELFMIMELVDGPTVEDLLLQCGQLHEQEGLALIAQAIDGLSWAHAQGVIHRDIKPANLMVTRAGVLKIMDFGIAHIRGSDRLTRHGRSVGTLEYMAPEQIRGLDVDERSDVYSLAIVLYQLLCGSPPFASSSEYELIRAQIEAAPPGLIGRVPGLRSEIEDAVMRALAKEPADRFQSVAAFGASLGISDLAGRTAEIMRSRLAALPCQPTHAAVPAAGATRLVSSSPPAKPITALVPAEECAVGHLSDFGDGPAAIEPSGTTISQSRSRFGATERILLAVSILLAAGLVGKLAWNEIHIERPSAPGGGAGAEDRPVTGAALQLAGTGATDDVRQSPTVDPVSAGETKSPDAADAIPTKQIETAEAPPFAPDTARPDLLPMAAPDGPKPWRDCDVCPEMMDVPAGRFMMGSTAEDPDAEDVERPQHEVLIAKAFALGRHEVTFDEWEACVSGGGCQGYRPSDARTGRGRQPVVNVSWQDAQTYVRWLGAKTGHSYRLPSEAEWEYAARAGTMTRFWWGDDAGYANANCRTCGKE
jgi:tRNA A-37 threonylcarbamoyl transferase component Bud32